MGEHSCPGVLRQFTQRPWIEHPTFQLRGEHFTTELLPPAVLCLFIVIRFLSIHKYYVSEQGISSRLRHHVSFSTHKASSNKSPSGGAVSRRITRSQRKLVTVNGSKYSDESDEEKTELVDTSTSPISPSDSFATVRRPVRRGVKAKSIKRNNSATAGSFIFKANGMVASGVEDKNLNSSTSTLGSAEPHRRNVNMAERVRFFLSSRLTHLRLTARLWDIHCSSLLPIGTVVFFTILGLLYVTLRSDENIYVKDRLIEKTSQVSAFACTW